MNAAIVGLGFGAEFIPIYQKHPAVNIVAVCRRNEAELHKIGDHARMSIAALKAGKHVMCTVPMATTIEECELICQLVADTGLRYMMAETVVYSREFLFIKDLYERGEFGKVQY